LDAQQGGGQRRSALVELGQHLLASLVLGLQCIESLDELFPHDVPSFAASCARVADYGGKSTGRADSSSAVNCSGVLPSAHCDRSLILAGKTMSRMSGTLPTRSRPIWRRCHCPDSSLSGQSTTCLSRSISPYSDRHRVPNGHVVAAQPAGSPRR